MWTCSVVALVLIVVAANAAPASVEPYATVDCSLAENQVILHPHPSSCSHFLQCNHGVPLERPCAPGTEFSPSIGVCVHPWQSDCTAEDSSEAEEEPEPELDGGEGARLLVSLFSIVFLAFVDILQMEAEEDESVEVDATTPVQEEELEVATEAAEEVDEEVNVPAESQDEESADLESEDESIPAPNRDPQEDVEAVVPEDALEGVEEEDPGVPQEDSASEEVEGPDVQEEEQEVVSPEVTCQSRADSFFLAAHPADCSAYVICNFGQAVLRSCSEGEFFNPNISTCTADSSHCA